VEMGLYDLLGAGLKQYGLTWNQVFRVAIAYASSVGIKWGVPKALPFF